MGVVAVIGLLVVSMVLVLPSNARASPTSVATSVGSSVAAPTASSSPASVQPAAGSPHPGTLEIYEYSAGAGATTEDPALAYDTLSFEPILQVYQTLIAYNGSSSGSFVPQLSTCVPGASDSSQSAPSVSCQSVYGSSLIVNGDSTGTVGPQYFTYVIDPNASFYDPSTGAHWGVYPSDVMFSIARTLAFTDQPGVGDTGGWILSQGLEQYGNGSWDGGIHYAFNNTPQGALGGILINDSTYCPTAASTSAHGCVTFNVTGSGALWPFFNQFVADDLGAGIVPCGWFSAHAQDAGLPGFTGPASGDGPCLLPGGAHSTSDAAYQSWLSTTSPTYWDATENLGLNLPAVQPAVQWNLVGSGPYYIHKGDMLQTVGYTAHANPYYVQPSGCVGMGLTGCQPVAGTYQGNVSVIYEPTFDTEGIQQYIAGQADQAFFQIGEIPVMLQLIATGKIGTVQAPTISIDFIPYNFDFNVTVEKTIDPTSSLNVQPSFFDNNILRDILNRAWPYTTDLNTLWKVDGVPGGFNYGGTIPIGMGDYYPTNVSFPYLGGDPCSPGATSQSQCNTSVGSAVWLYWQATNSLSPNYDSELAACTSSAPCKFPIIGEIGATALDKALQNWINMIPIITNNTVQPYTFDISFSQAVGYSFSLPGDNPMPMFRLGWAPDYPDPTDYVAPMIQGNSTYTNSNSVSQVLFTPAYGTCGHDGTTWANLTYWANYPDSHGGAPLPSDCQGNAYAIVNAYALIASPMPVGADRTLIYNEITHITEQLGMYVWTEQGIRNPTYAKWIDPASINTNVMIGGGGDELWYAYGYSTAISTVTFSETGLASGQTWSVEYAGQSYSSSTATISIPGQAVGNYSYQVGYVSGYTVSSGAVNGTISVVKGSHPTLSVGFSSVTTGSSLKFQEKGLPSGAVWTVVVQGVGGVTGTQTSLNFSLPSGTYNYSVANTTTGYSAPAPGSAATGSTVVLQFTPLSVKFDVYPVTVTEHGALGAAWGVTISPAALSPTAVGFGYSYVNTTSGTTMTYWEQNSTIGYNVTDAVIATAGMEGYIAQTSFAVAGGPVSVDVYFYSTGVPATYSVTFTATGQTGSWSVSFNGHTLSTTGSTLSFSAPNGTYTYSVVIAPSGEAASPPGGQVTVSGAAAQQQISFAPLPSKSTTTNNVPSWAYAVIGIFVVLTIVFLVTTLMARRRPPSPPAPQSWTPGTESKAGEIPPPPPSS